jgi:PAS domain S-box-containing protein
MAKSLSSLIAPSMTRLTALAHAAAAFCVGLGFLAVAAYFEARAAGEGWVEALLRRSNPLLYVIDAVPFALGLLGYLIGLRQARIVECERRLRQASNDISDLLLVEREHWMTAEQLRAILESANYSVIATDRDGVIHTFNRSAERKLGYSAAEVVGKLTPAFIHVPQEVQDRALALSIEIGWEVPPGFETFVAKARLGFPDENEWTYVRKDGSRFPVRLSVTALRGPEQEIVGFLGIAHDMSEEKAARDSLIEAKRQALAAAHAKAEFLANMSHEIRTPMNGVIGMCELLLGSVQEPAHVERLKVIQQCGSSLLELIDDILDLSKIEAGKIELERAPFGPEAAAGEVVRLLEPLASRKGLFLEHRWAPEVPAWVVGDVTRFKQVLTNLVSNAIKFTEAGGVTIEGRARPLSGGELEIRVAVRDTGIGVPAHAQDRLFSSFSQVDASTTRKFGGTGLGLAICKGICERMGGSIGLEGREGQGSTFFFTFVASACEAPARPEAPAFAKSVVDLARERPLRILVAEDNRVNQLVLVGLLESLGYGCDLAFDGKGVLERLALQSYDLIFMDCHMPEMDGFEVTRRIRNSLLDKSPRIVAVTASTLREDVERCIESGMDGFVSKPVTVPALAAILDEAAQGAAASAGARGKSFEALPSAAESAPLVVMREEEFWTNFTGMEHVADLLARNFVDSASELVGIVRETVRKDDAPALEHAAHTLRGIVANFRAERAGSAAEKLERIGRSRELAESAAAVETLEREIAVLVERVRAVVLQRREAA